MGFGVWGSTWEKKEKKSKHHLIDFGKGTGFERGGPRAPETKIAAGPCFLVNVVQWDWLPTLPLSPPPSLPGLHGRGPRVPGSLH